MEVEVMNRIVKEEVEVVRTVDEAEVEMKNCFVSQHY